MRIGLDLDGVIYHWTRAAIEILNQRCPGEPYLTPFHEPNNWDELEEIYGEAQFSQLWEPDTVRTMFGTAAPFFGARFFITQLAKHHEVIVMTARPEAVRQTTVWRWNLDFGDILFPSFVFVDRISEKGLYPCDLFIDDHPHSDLICHKSKKPLLLMDKRYNADAEMHPFMTRVADYAEILNEIARMENPI